MLKARLFETIEFRKAAFTKTMDRVLGEIIRESAREWLRTLVSGVPVETGMARGALAPLGRFLRVAIPIFPNREPYFSRLEGGTVSPEFGASKSSFVLESNRGDYQFEWSTEVLHYWLADFYKGSAVPGEYLLDEAEETFFLGLDERLEKRLPEFADFVRIKRL